jgi:hypothetical protein
MSDVRRSTTKGAFLGTLLLWAGLALANGINTEVSKAIGGKTNPAYKAVRGKALRLNRPWRVRQQEATPGQGPSISMTSRHGDQVNYLDEGHYRDVRDMALTLMRTYRPDKHFYIALGRSPTALASFLQELNPNMVMTFPASHLRLGVQATWKQAYFDHFKDLIPDDVLRGERTIVLFDRSHNQSGTSLGKVRAFLEEYLSTINGKQVPVRAAGMAAQGPLATGVDHLSTAEHPNVFQYKSRDFDEDFAPFLETHQIGAQTMDTIQPNQNYWRLRTALRNRMAHDEELKAVLKKDFKDHLDDD